MAIDLAVDVSWVAVVVGTIGYQALGALWYGPLFGDHWMAAMGFAEPADAHGDGDPRMGYLLTTVGSLLAAVALGLLVDWTGATTVAQGALLGGVVGVGFVATSALQAVPFEGRPWAVYGLNVGYNVIALAGIGALLVLL